MKGTDRTYVGDGRITFDELIEKANGRNLKLLEKGAELLKKREELRLVIDHRIDETPEPGALMRLCRTLSLCAAAAAVVCAFSLRSNNTSFLISLAAAAGLYYIYWKDKGKRKLLGMEAERRREKEKEGLREKLSQLEKEFEESYAILPPQYQNSAAYKEVAKVLREGRAFSLTEALEKFKQEADEICALMEEMSSVVVKHYDPEYWEEYWECQMMKDTWDGL